LCLEGGFMDNIKVLVINDEGGDIRLEEEIISNSLGLGAGELTITYIPAGDRETIEKELPEAHGVISVYTHFDRKTLEGMKKCRIIATQTIGTNTIDLDAATEFGICVTNVPDYCIEEVALHTVTLAMACVRKIRVYDMLARSKKWNIEDIYKEGTAHRLQGRRYGLVSFGNIAKRVAELMKGFGMKVMAYDPYLEEAVFEEYGVEKVDSLEELFSSCNIISLHTPLTPKTEGMIDMNIVAAGLADKCEVEVAYAIGVAKPISIMVETFGTNKVADEIIEKAIAENFDLRPAAIIDKFNLRRPIYQKLAAYGHFGREDLDLPWEKTDMADVLKKYLQ
jgi:lactate dehydrogenase-like 2-hydroxyacid dehydrogenase